MCLWRAANGTEVNFGQLAAKNEMTHRMRAQKGVAAAVQESGAQLMANSIPFADLRR